MCEKYSIFKKICQNPLSKSIAVFDIYSSLNIKNAAISKRLKRYEACFRLTDVRDVMAKSLHVRDNFINKFHLFQLGLFNVLSWRYHKILNVLYLKCPRYCYPHTYVIYILTISPSVFDWGRAGEKGVEVQGHKPSWIKGYEKLQGEFREGWRVNGARPQADQ